jgi:hypothetical protein
MQLAIRTYLQYLRSRAPELQDGKTNGAVDLADRPVPSANVVRGLGEADLEGPTDARFDTLKKILEGGRRFLI